MRMRSIGALVAVWFSLSCAGPTDPSQTDMTAEEHRAEAARLEAQAREHDERYDPNARRTSPEEGLGPLTVGGETYNPTEHERLAAEEQRRHAAAHREVAADLLAFAERECAGVPEAARAACPLLLDVARLESIERGVRLFLNDGPNVDAVADHIRCHLAFAAAHGREGMESCALYVPGASVEVRGAVIDLTTARSDEVADLRRRVHLQAP